MGLLKKIKYLTSVKYSKWPPKAEKWVNIFNNIDLAPNWISVYGYLSLGGRHISNN